MLLMHPGQARREGESEGSYSGPRDVWGPTCRI